MHNVPVDQAMDIFYTPELLRLLEIPSMIFHLFLHDFYSPLLWVVQLIIVGCRISHEKTRKRLREKDVNPAGIWHYSEIRTINQREFLHLQKSYKIYRKKNNKNITFSKKHLNLRQ